MPRNGQREDVSCAICLDSLFAQPNDLDEPLKAVAIRCGHMFHEVCLNEWFGVQERQWLANERLYGDAEAPDEDGPTTCATCRTEVFLDPDTERPEVFRLHPSMDHASWMQAAGAGSSQVGSSPARASRKGKEREREVIGLARRARDLTEQVEGLDAGSSEVALHGLMVRTQGLEEEISEKGLKAIKTYLGGLNSALNGLRATLHDNPLNQTMQKNVLKLREEVKAAKQQLRVWQENVLPLEVRRAVEAERRASEERVKRAEERLESRSREFDKAEAVLRARKAAAEAKEQVDAREITMLRTHLKKEIEEKQEVQEMLDSRSKILLMWQAKYASRKERKAEKGSPRKTAPLEEDDEDVLVIKPPPPPKPSGSRPDKRVNGTGRTYEFDLGDDVARLAKRAKPSLVLVPSSSPLHGPGNTSEVSSSPTVLRTANSNPNPNPFATTKQASEQRRLLKPAPTSSGTIIDLTGNSRGESSETGRRLGLASGLVLTDRHGRPRQGVVGGGRVKLRA